MYVRALTAEEVAVVLQTWEPFRERIERILDDYEEDEQSWRDYRNACFDWLPDPLKPAVSGPADNTERCPVCGMAPQVRGCEPGKCRGEAAFAVVHAPVRPDAPFVANPGDFFNGWPLSAFCETCRLGILEIGRTERSRVTLCAACTAMMMRQPAPEEPPPGAPSPRMSGVSVAPDGSVRLELGNPAPKEKAANDNRIDHPLPWRWIRYGEALALADGASNALALGSGRVGVVIPSAYVRAVTERARALDEALRWALSWLDDLVDFQDHESVQRMKAAAARKLLAEIDAAKAGE